IGKELRRPAWRAVGRELVRLGLAAQTEGPYPTLRVTDRGRETLRTRAPVTLTRPAASVDPPPSPPPPACDIVLFQRLPALRHGPPRPPAGAAPRRAPRRAPAPGGAGAPARRGAFPPNQGDRRAEARRPGRALQGRHRRAPGAPRPPPRGRPGPAGAEAAERH